MMQLWLLLLLASPTLSEVPLPAELLDVRTGDANGDGRVDVFVAGIREDGTREVRIHLQAQSSSYRAQPDRRVSIKRDIVAWSIADVHPEVGDELLLFTPRSVFSYRTAQSSYRTGATKVAAFDFVCDLVDARSLPFVDCARDIDGDGQLDLLIPGLSGYGYFARTKAGFERRSFLVATVPDSKPGAQRRGRSISFGIGMRRPPARSEDSILKDLELTAVGPILEATRWIPAIRTAHVNNDRRSDLLLVDEYTEPPSLVVFLQKDDGTFPDKPDARLLCPPGEELTLADVDNDGQEDLISVESDGAEKQLLRIYRNKAGQFSTDAPDQLLRFEALGLQFEVLDVDGKPGSELAVLTYSIASKLEILSGAIERKLLVYERDPGRERVFRRRPSLSRPEKLTADHYRSMDTPVAVSGDLDASGVRDLVFVDRSGALVAYSISKRLKVDSAPYHKHMPEHRIQGFDLLDLDGNGSTDVILHQHRRLQILVSP